MNRDAEFDNSIRLDSEGNHAPAGVREDASIGRSRAIQRMFESVWQSHYRRNPDELGTKYSELLEEQQDELRSNKVTYWLITINPRCYPETTDTAFKHAINKFLAKVWLRSYIGTVEFGKKQIHPHFHVLLKKNKPKSEVIRETFSTFKDLCGDKASIDVRPIREKDHEKTLEYITKDYTLDTILRVEKGYKERYQLDNNDPEDDLIFDD